MMRPRVIVIDDDRYCRELLTLFLKRNGYEVVSLEEPTGCPLYPDLECQCSHEDACGDFLLTDNRMPRMTGLEFVGVQQKRGCKGAVRNKAVISASWSAEELQHATRLGCKVFHKPYNIENILRWLKEREKLIPPERKLVAFDEGS